MHVSTLLSHVVSPRYWSLAYPRFHRFVWHGVPKDFKREITYRTSNHWRAASCSKHLALCLGIDAGARGLPYLMRYVNQPEGRLINKLPWVLCTPFHRYLAYQIVMKTHHPAKPNKHHPQYYFTRVSKEITCLRPSELRNFTRLHLFLPSPLP